MTPDHSGVFFSSNTTAAGAPPPPPAAYTTQNSSSGGCPPVGIQLEGLILPPVLAVDVALGLLGNAVAFWVFCRRLRAWNPNDLFLFQLVVADFLALVSLPLRIHALLRGHWAFGDGLCRLNLFLMFTNRSASIGLMTAVAVHRYFKVVHPHHRFNRMTMRQAAWVSAAVWLLMTGPRLPMLAYSHIKASGGGTQCFFFTSYGEASRAILFLVAAHRALSVLEFLAPLVLLLFCSARISHALRRRTTVKARSARRAVRACAAIVAVFVVCFLPGAATTVGLWVVGTRRPRDCGAFYALTQLTVASFGLTFLNSALDPVVYCFSSTMFRKALVGALPGGFRRRCAAATERESESGQAASGRRSNAAHELTPMKRV